MTLHRIKEVFNRMSEGYFETVIIPLYNNMEIPVYKNPTPEEIVKIGKSSYIRFLVDTSNWDIYVWDGNRITHGDVLKNSKLIPEFKNYMQGFYSFIGIRGFGWNKGRGLIKEFMKTHQAESILKANTIIENKRGL